MSKQFSTEHIDKAIEKLNEEPKQSIADDLKAYFTQMLKNADFVQVVRCKDCKYYTEYFPVIHKTKKKVFYCCGGFVDSQMALNPDYYCSYGERRESE